MDDKDRLDQELARALAEELSEIHADEMLVQQTLSAVQKSKQTDIITSEGRFSGNVDTQEKKKSIFKRSRFLKTKFLSGALVTAAGIVMIVIIAAQREPKKSDAQYESSLNETAGGTQNSTNSIQNYPDQTPDFFEGADGSMSDNNVSDNFLEPSATEDIWEEPEEKELLSELLAIVREEESGKDNLGVSEISGEHSEKNYIIQEMDGWPEELEQEMREAAWQSENESLVCRVYQNGKIALYYTKDKNSSWYILDSWYGAQQLWKEAK